MREFPRHFGRTLQSIEETRASPQGELAPMRDPLRDELRTRQARFTQLSKNPFVAFGWRFPCQAATRFGRKGKSVAFAFCTGRIGSNSTFLILRSKVETSFCLQG